MENRRPVHYFGNTVELPERTEKIKHAKKHDDFGREKKHIFERENKVFMTNICAFCGNKGEEYRSICRFCGTCQYCGLRSTQRDLCRFCGNRDIIKRNRPKKSFIA